MDGAHHLGQLSAASRSYLNGLGQPAQTEDKLYHDYQTVLEGRKELTLNRERAEYVFNQLYLPDAREYRHHIVRADTLHLSAVDFVNIMMSGAIWAGVLDGRRHGVGECPPWRRPIP